MGKNKNFTGKMFTAVLAASMLFGETALAEPLDELNGIFENQQNAATGSLLAETLGWSDLGDAIAKNGLNFQMEAGLTEGTAKMLGIDGEIPEDGQVKLGLQVDPDQEAWALSAGAGDGTESVLDMVLYGNREKLALTVPQFFAGALTLGAGNLKEQYDNSALAGLLGGTGDMPDIDMSFYPDEDSLDELAEPFGDGNEQLGQKLEELGTDARVEKREDGDDVIYTVTVDTEDIADLYTAMFDAYFDVFDSLGMISDTEDLDSLQQETEEMFGLLGSVIGDEISMDIVTRDGLMEELRYELYCDTTVLEEAGEDLTEIVEEELSPAGNAEDAAEGSAETDSTVAVIGGADGPTSVFVAGKLGGAENETEITLDSQPFQGYISYDIIYHDPADLGKGFRMDMTMTDLEEQEIATYNMEWNRTDSGFAQEYSCSMEMTQEGETIYSGTPLTASFDSETGDFDAVLSMEDDDGSSVAVKLDSTFSQIEKGQSFVWDIDSLTVENDGESVGITSRIQVSAEPGQLPAPESEREVLKLDETQLSGLMQEIQMNAIMWGARFIPEQETETETGLS